MSEETYYVVKAEPCGDLIASLRAERDAWMNAVADVVEPYGFDREAASGPADLIPGLRWLVEDRDAEVALANQLRRALIALEDAWSGNNPDGWGAAGAALAAWRSRRGGDT